MGLYLSGGSCLSHAARRAQMFGLQHSQATTATNIFVNKSVANFAAVVVFGSCVVEKD